MNLASFERNLWDQLGILGVPEHIHEGIIEYIMRGRPTGSFLQAVISNDLQASFALADHMNLNHMHGIVTFFHWHCPSIAWRSREAYESWKGMEEYAREAGSLEGAAP